MEGIKIWIMSISGVTLIMAIIAAVSPKNTAGRVCVMLGQIALIAVVIAPIKTGFSGGISNVKAAYDSAVRESVLMSEEKCGEIEEKLICENLSAYVLNKAGASGEISIELRERVPFSATGTVEGKSSAERVEKLLSEELGISKDKQEIRIGGE